jgi:cytochrome c biogenesis protein CcmG, thiol:disulfide interchange protein DsbE
VKRAVPWVLGVVILTVVLVIGLSQAGSKPEDDTPAKPFDLQASLRELEGAPAPLAKLHDQAGTLLDGGVPAFQKQLAALEGRPVVINKWASWCHPCRAEFPIFQQVATEQGKRVAFLGIDGADSTQPAQRFLTQFPVPYPSYKDTAEKIAQTLKAVKNYPITVFMDPSGRTFIKQGGYRSADELRADIAKYAAA